MIYPYLQFLHNLLGKAQCDPRKLVGDVYNEANSDSSNVPLHAWSCFYRMMLCYTIGDMDHALKEAEGCKVILHHRQLGTTSELSMYVHPVQVLRYQHDLHMALFNSPLRSGLYFFVHWQIWLKL